MTGSARRRGFRPCRPGRARFPWTDDSARTRRSGARHGSGAAISSVVTAEVVEMTEQVTEHSPVATAAEGAAPPPEGGPGGDAKAAQAAVGGLLFKNTMFMMVAQVMGTPLSMIVNAMIARYL